MNTDIEVSRLGGCLWTSGRVPLAPPAPPVPVIKPASSHGCGGPSPTPRPEGRARNVTKNKQAHTHTKSVRVFIGAYAERADKISFVRHEGGLCGRL